MPIRTRPVRGATQNEVSRRFHLPEAVADGDWLDARGSVDGEAPRLRTTVTVETARTIISRNASPDIPFDRSVNPYRGCEHGCIYCFARPSHAFLDLSPVICPLLSGPRYLLFWMMKEIGNAVQEAQAGGDHRQAA